MFDIFALALMSLFWENFSIGLEREIEIERLSNRESCGEKPNLQISIDLERENFQSAWRERDWAIERVWELTVAERNQICRNRAIKLSSLVRSTFRIKSPARVATVTLGLAHIGAEAVAPVPIALLVGAIVERYTPRWSRFDGRTDLRCTFVTTKPTAVNRATN